MLRRMNRHKTRGIGQALLRFSSGLAGLGLPLLAVLRAVLAASDSGTGVDRSIQDADLIGDYNFRTQQFDSGTDPAGWYEDEP